MEEQPITKPCRPGIVSSSRVAPPLSRNAPPPASRRVEGSEQRVGSFSRTSSSNLARARATSPRSTHGTSSALTCPPFHLLPTYLPSTIYLFRENWANYIYSPCVRCHRPLPHHRPLLAMSHNELLAYAIYLQQSILF